MRRAAHIDANQPEIVRALLQVGCSVQSLAGVGCGCPDLLVWSPYSLLYVLMEVKNPDRLNGSQKDKFTDDQKRFAKAWRGPIAVVETPGEALRAVGLQGEAING